MSEFQKNEDGLAELSPVVQLVLGNPLDMKFEFPGHGKLSFIPVLLEHGHPQEPDRVQLALSVDQAKLLQIELSNLLDEREAQTENQPVH